MCNRGERCNFIHVVHVDPNVVGDFKRAPCCKPKISSTGEGGCGGDKHADAVAQHSEGKVWGAPVSDRRNMTGRSLASFRPNSEARPFEPRNALGTDGEECGATPLGIVCAPHLGTINNNSNPNYFPSQHFMTGGGNSIAVPAAIAVQMAARPVDQQLMSAAQYGMLVFVPCDSTLKATPVSPAVLNPPSAQSGGAPSIHVLPTTALDLMHAAYPGLSGRWSSPGSDPASQAEVLMRSGASTDAGLGQGAACFPYVQHPNRGELMAGPTPQDNVMGMYGGDASFHQQFTFQHHQGDHPSRRSARSRGGGAMHTLR